MVETFGVDLSGLVLDMTNFATWIDSRQRAGADRPAGPLQAETERPAHRRSRAGRLHRRRHPAVSPRLSGQQARRHPVPGDGRRARRPLRGLWGRGAHAKARASPWSSTPGRTPRTTTSCSTARPLSFVGSLPPSDHPDLLAVGKDRYQVVDEERFPGLTAFETTKVVFGKRAPPRRLPLHEPPRQAVPGLRPDPGQGPPPTRRARRPVSARGRTRKPRDKVEAEIAAILAPRWVGPGHLDHPDRRHAGRAAPQLPHQRPRPAPCSKTSCSANGSSSPTRPPEQPRPPDRRRLPLPRGRRGRLPPDERPQSRLVLPDVPLDRAEDPRPRLLLRARPHGRPAHGPRGRAGRARTSASASCSTPSPGSKRPCCSTKANGDGPEPGACSPRSTPPSGASTTSSASTPTPPSADLGTTGRTAENNV